VDDPEGRHDAGAYDEHAAGAVAFALRPHGRSRAGGGRGEGDAVCAHGATRGDRRRRAVGRAWLFNRGAQPSSSRRRRALVGTATRSRHNPTSRGSPIETTHEEVGSAMRRLVEHGREQLCPEEHRAGDPAVVYRGTTVQIDQRSTDCGGHSEMKSRIQYAVRALRLNCRNMGGDTGHNFGFPRW